MIENKYDTDKIIEHVEKHTPAITADTSVFQLKKIKPDMTLCIKCVESMLRDAIELSRDLERKKHNAQIKKARKCMLRHKTNESKCTLCKNTVCPLNEANKQ